MHNIGKIKTKKVPMSEIFFRKLLLESHLRLGFYGEVRIH